MNCMQFDPFGSRLAILTMNMDFGGMSQEVRVLPSQGEQREEKLSLEIGMHSYSPSTMPAQLAFGLDGRILAAGSQRGRVAIWMAQASRRETWQTSPQSRRTPQGFSAWRSATKASGWPPWVKTASYNSETSSPGSLLARPGPSNTNQPVCAGLGWVDRSTFVLAERRKGLHFWSLTRALSKSIDYAGPIVPGTLPTSSPSRLSVSAQMRPGSPLAAPGWSRSL